MVRFLVNKSKLSFLHVPKEYYMSAVGFWQAHSTCYASFVVTCFCVTIDTGQFLKFVSLFE
jgi:hypothetical protein